MSSELVLLFAGQGSRATFSSASATTLLNRVAQHDIASLILQRCHESLLQDFLTIDTSERTILTEADAKSLTTPQDLVKPSATLAQNPVIQAVTFYLHQILEYVFYVQREREGQPQDTISEAAGFCSGILPALVVAVNTPIESPQFLEYAVGTFRLAFWTSIRSASYSKSLAGATWGALPWSLVVAGLTKEALETALTSAQSQLSHRVRVSAVLGDDMFSLSGTGVDLDRLRSLLPTTSTHRPAFIHTCYHGGEDMEEVVQEILRDVKRLEILFPDWEALKIPVRSTVDGTFLASTQPQSDTLLEAAIRCMLIHPVDWQATASNILDSASQRLDMNAELCSRVLALGPNGGSLFTSAKNTVLHQRLQIEHSTSSKSIGSESWHKSDIAIVGMSLDIPGGEDLQAFWDMLQNSTNVSTEIPSSRFNLFDYYDKDVSNNPKPRKMAAKHGNFLKNPFHFDNRFFSISPREANSMDPQQRLILQSALRALDDAGYAPNTTESFQPDKMGVFIGAATGDYVDNTRSDIDVYYSPGTLRAFLSGRISYAFGFKGPSVVIDTACSSSLVAIHQACIALERGDAVSALAGGVNVISSPDMYLGLARAHFLSPTGQCKPFDAAADGYCRAESSVVFVLKRMEDAIAHGDRIHGIIRGTSVNQSGTSKSITHPDAETQALLMRNLLDRTKIPARSISVVEAHGTGTQAGDLCEITSLQAVLGQGSGRQQPLCLGSIKGNIGHAEAASGGVGLAKLLLMMQRKKIPPQASFQHLNPRLSSIADHNIMIPTRVMDWNSTHDSPRRALLNNFGAAGSNAALILEEFRTTTWVASSHSRSTHVLNISAKTQEALVELRSRYLDLLRNKSHENIIPLSDLCYSANARRQHPDEFRISVTGKSIQDLAEQLANTDTTKRSAKKTQPLNIFVFSGQANLYRGMGAELQSTAPVFRKTVLQCDASLRQQGIEGIVQYITNDGSGIKGNEEVVSQCACFVVQYALAKLWQSWGIEPDFVVGHSMGEYAALVLSEALKLDDALRLIAQRAQLMVTHCTPAKTGMVAVKLSVDDARVELVQLFGTPAPLAVACENSPEDCVVAGDIDHLNTFLRHCKAVGTKALQLQVPFGFHSPAMEPAVNPYRELCSDIKMSEGRIPILSSHLGRFARLEDLSVDFLPSHMRRPVRFSDAIRSLEIVTVGRKMRVLEIGHTSGTTALVKKSLKEGEATYMSSLRPTESPWASMSTTLKALFLESAPVKWSEVYAGSSTRYLDATPKYPLFPAEFVIPFREPLVESTESKKPLSGPATRLFFQLDKKSSTGTTITTFEARLSLMSSFIRAHIVGGTPLCPASIYLELALQAMDQVQPALQEQTQVLRDIIFESPLVQSSAREDEGSLALVMEKKDARAKGHGYAFKAEKSGTCYCTGTIDLEAVSSVKPLLSRKSAFLMKHVESMINGGHGAGDSFSTRMIYDVVFPRVVAYSDPFLTLRRLRISPSGLEGYGSFRLPANSSNAEFVCHPALVDTLLHTAGFVANNWINRDQSCICVKVENITLLHDRISASVGDDLSIYASMVDCIDGFVIGDAYAMDRSGQVIAMAEGMHFKKTELKGFQNHLARLAGNGQNQRPAPPRRNSAMDKVHQERPKHHSIRQRTPEPDIRSVVRHEVSRLCGITSEIDGDADLAQLGVDSLLFIELTQSLSQKLAPTGSSGLDLSQCSTLRDLEAVFLGATVAPTYSDEIVRANEEILPAPANNKPIVSTKDSPLRVVKDMVEQVCGCAIFDLDKDMSLEDVGVDSLLSMELEQGLRQMGGISIDGGHGTISELTIGQLESLILSKLSQSQAPITPQSTPSPVCAAAATKLQNGKDSRSRMYLFHDGSGLSHQYAKIGPLGCDVFGVSSLDFAGIDPSVHSLADFAWRYISELGLAVHDAQGIIVGGWSFGGVLAFEIARQLQDLGTPVKGLILLDSPYPIDHEPLPDTIIEHIAGTAFEAHPDIRSCVAAQFKRNAGLLKDYKRPPGSFQVPTVMLLSREACDTATLRGLKYAWLDDEDFRKMATQMWRTLVGDKIETMDIDGNHFNMFEAKHLQSLSEKLLTAYNALA